MTQEANSSTVAVEIFGQPFTLSGSDPERIRMLAECVDARMREFAGKYHIVDSAKLGVFAAVAIASDYFNLKTERDGNVSNPSSPGGDFEQRNRERRAAHFTRRKYEKKLLEIASGKLVPTKERARPCTISAVPEATTGSVSLSCGKSPRPGRRKT